VLENRRAIRHSKPEALATAEQSDVKEAVDPCKAGLDDAIERDRGVVHLYPVHAMAKEG
jgi:hypothetical protein